MTIDPTIRPARKADASDIALLVNIATHGGAASNWRGQPEAQETYDSIEVGRLGALRDDSFMNWRNATMAEIDGEVAGMLLGYREPDVAEAVPATTSAFMRALYELEAEAASTWFISMLGVYVPWRGQGIGGKLLDVAEDKCRETGARGLALISEDVNTGARRLYERRGFAVRSSRPIAAIPGGPKGKDWLLMVKE